MPIRRFLIAAIALAMPAALPALASSATVTADGAGSETNVVTVTAAGPEWVIGDTAAPLTAGTGCTQATPSEARCPKTAARPTATLDGGAGEDLITYTSATVPVTVDLPAGTGGQPGEHDVVQGVEDVTAGGTLIGDAGISWVAFGWTVAPARGKLWA